MQGNEDKEHASESSESPLDAPGWRPIETAPRGTVPVLLGAVGCEILGMGYAEFAGTLCTDGHAPTHWMPLPSPPDASTERDSSERRYRDSGF